MRAVALILDGQPVEVIGLDGRNAYPHESVSAVVTVSVHLDGALSVDQVGDVLGLGEDPVPCGGGIYQRAGDWLPGVHLSLYGSAKASGVS